MRIFFSSDDSLMTRLSEEGVNVIVSCFNDSAPVEIEYCSKPVVAPVVICLLRPFFTNPIKLYHISIMLQF